MNDVLPFVIPDVKLRICLKCSKRFRSLGPGNRICPVCKKINAGLGTIGERALAGQRGIKRHNGIPLDPFGLLDVC